MWSFIIHSLTFSSNSLNRKATCVAHHESVLLFWQQPLLWVICFFLPVFVSDCSESVSHFKKRKKNTSFSCYLTVWNKLQKKQKIWHKVERNISITKWSLKKGKKIVNETETSTNWRNDGWHGIDFSRNLCVSELMMIKNGNQCSRKLNEMLFSSSLFTLISCKIEARQRTKSEQKRERKLEKQIHFHVSRWAAI